MTIGKDLADLKAAVAKIPTTGGSGGSSIPAATQATIDKTAADVATILQGSDAVSPPTGTGKFASSITGINVADATQVAVGAGLFAAGVIAIASSAFVVSPSDSLNSIAAGLQALLTQVDPTATVTVGGTPGSMSLTVNSTVNVGFTGSAVTDNAPTFAVGPVAVV